MAIAAKTVTAPGDLVGDGRAVDIVIPGSTQVYHGELIHVVGTNGKGVNGVALIGDGRTQPLIDTADADRACAMEVAPDRIWEVPMPTGFTTAPAFGDYLYWAAPGSFQKGSSDLRPTAATAGDGPACQVVKAPNANGYLRVMIKNSMSTT